MFNISNYYQQSHGLPAEDELQLMLLKWADASTLVRESSKYGTAIGLVVSATSLVFNFNPTIALTFTAISGVSWLLSRTCAQKLEPEAEEMIKHFKELKEGRHIIHQNDAKTFGLLD
jgi:hypothetical protein